MKTRLLVLALLAAPAASFALTPQDAALIKVEQQASQWQEWQVRAADMEKAYVDDAIKNSADQTLKCLGDIDRIEPQGERRMRNWRDSKIAAFNAQAVAGTITTDEAEHRAAFVERLYRMRMLLIYGNLVPRSIDECARHEDAPDEAVSAGAWALAASKKEFNLAEHELVRISGLPDADAYVP